MRNILVAVVVMSTLGVAAAAQVPGLAYAGTWVADLTGTTYVRLELEPFNGTLRGRIALGNVQFDRQGQVRKAEAPSRPSTPIIDVSLRITGISFSHKDGNDTDRFEMRLVDRETAELLFIPTDEDRKELAAAGIGDLKPIRLKRVAS
jgi:hypothetical protein